MEFGDTLICHRFFIRQFQPRHLEVALVGPDHFPTLTVCFLLISSSRGVPLRPLLTLLFLENNFSTPHFLYSAGSLPTFVSSTQHLVSKSDTIKSFQLSGCQVACTFYEEQSARSGPVSALPVVPASRQNVLQFSDGKIQWPRSPNQLDLALSPDTLVYVVIQQYPDHKWRQITQVCSFFLFSLVPLMKTCVLSCREAVLTFSSPGAQETVAMLIHGFVLMYGACIDYRPRCPKLMFLEASVWRRAVNYKRSVYWWSVRKA